MERSRGNLTYLHPVGIFVRKSVIEKFAEEAASSLGFEPGGSLEELVVTTGGQLVVGSSGVGDVESGSIVARALNDYTIYISRHTSRQRDRFTIAHELGHLMLHFPTVHERDPTAVMRATRWVDDQDPKQMRAEWEANWFAAAFLMPEIAFRKAVEDGAPNGLKAAQEKFDVSATAAEIRARALGLTS